MKEVIKCEERERERENEKVEKVDFFKSGGGDLTRPPKPKP